mmetsp:Transcript_33122/g.51482  ORF Transcript_33122/g.51482 Transcript_33122/m.51482 type:complete len:170 (-) Transcript_33122:47-556(-)
MVAWRAWDGPDVANFISLYCDLPQYAETAKRNLTGAYLDDLLLSGMLGKGLARAGICDLDHQQNIRDALFRLRRTHPEELSKILQEREASVSKLTRRNSTPKNLPPLRKAPRTISYPVNPFSTLGIWTPEPTQTTKILQKSCSEGMLLTGKTYPNSLRRTPPPWGCFAD